MTKISGARAKTTHKATQTKPKARAKTETAKPAAKPKSTGWGPAVSSGGGEYGRGSSYTPSPPSYSSGGGE